MTNNNDTAGPPFLSLDAIPVPVQAQEPARAALAALQRYAWPGNIRELENEMQRIVIQGVEGAEIEPDDLSPALRRVKAPSGRDLPPDGTLREMMGDVERALLRRALAASGGNKTRAAEGLGITREGLHKKLAKLGMT